MTDKQLHEILVEILHTDTAVFLASGPSLREMAERLDGLAEVQVALDEVRETMRRRFIGLLEQAEPAGSDAGRSPVSAGRSMAREHPTRARGDTLGGTASQDE